MTYPNPSTALGRVFVDELARSGVRWLLAAPGSRSTALVLAASEHPDLTVVMAADERSAAFHALGWVKASGEPAAVVTTSGTAVANLYPAVVEADSADAPLIVVTADRPPELRGVGANQAIDQTRFFGRFVRISIEMGPGESHPSEPNWWRSTVSQLVGIGRGFWGRSGPVHVNVAFREPTVPVSHDGRTGAEPYPFDSAGRDGSDPWVAALPGRFPGPAVVERVAAHVAGKGRGIILAGRGSGTGRAIARLGRHLRWPVLATAESGMRGIDGVLSTGHHLVEEVEADMILRFGDPGPSRRILDVLSRPIPQVVVSSTWSDPARTAQLMVAADAGGVAEGLIEATEAREEGEWIGWWERCDTVVREALAPELTGRLSEPAAAHTVAGSGADLAVVASSMPIRDIEAFAFGLPPLVANRGASGIDGFVSTALGASRTASRTVALAGDLSMLHDSNGFLVDDLPSCVFVVVDNGGGGIFSFLPQHEHTGSAFDRLFSTPHGRDLGSLARLHELAHRRVSTTTELEQAIAEGWNEDGPVIVVAPSDRDENVREHARLNRLVSDALGRA